jgi:hypothetical protein
MEYSPVMASQEKGSKLTFFLVYKEREESIGLDKDLVY